VDRELDLGFISLVTDGEQLNVNGSCVDTCDCWCDYDKEPD